MTPRPYRFVHDFLVSLLEERIFPTGQFLIQMICDVQGVSHRRAHDAPAILLVRVAAGLSSGRRNTEPVIGKYLLKQLRIQ